MKKVSCHHRDAGSKCSYSIKIGPEHRRSLVHEDITQYSTTNPSQHSHQGGHERVESGGQSFLRSGDRKQCQPSAIK